MTMASGHVEESSPELKAVADAPRSNLRILLAEDNPVNQKVTRGQLERLGYGCDIAGNGLEALEAISAVTYDLVLMDCQMPELDGYAAVAELRKREHPLGRRVPVIALTAHAMDGEREKCLAAGMDDYLSKPLTISKLQQMMAKWDRGEPTVKRTSTLMSDINMAILMDCASGGGIGEIVELYFEQMDLRMPDLKAALAAGNATDVATIAHTSAGSSITCGMLAVAKSMRRMEQFGNDNKLDAAREEFQTAERALEAARSYLSKFTAPSNPGQQGGIS
jgi:CheY-like chemotaxis protein